MNWLVNNWVLIVACGCLIAVVAVHVMQFFAKPTEEQKKMVREWLLAAVTAAEAEFGKKTGSIKLSYVYNTFVQAMPAIAAIMPFETFRTLVDDALVEMRKLLTDSPEVLGVFRE